MAQRGWRRCWIDRQGTAMIEGAIVLGVLATVIVQAVSITQYYGASVRATQAADGIANMVSQERSISTASLSDIEDAAENFLLPYDPPLAIEVAHIVYRPDGTASLATADGGWRLASNGALFTDQELIASATGLGLSGEALIVVRLRHRDSQRFASSMSILPDLIEETAFAKTRTGRPVLIQ